MQYPLLLIGSMRSDSFGPWSILRRASRPESPKDLDLDKGICGHYKYSIKFELSGNVPCCEESHMSNGPVAVVYKWGAG
jgi:hypothetical protein